MTSSPSPSHWVETLFPPQYSIRDYRATFQPDHQRIRRYITTLSSFDAPTLAAIYEQSYLFTLIQRLAKQEEDEKSKSKTKTKSNQTEPIESVLDIRLIRSYLEKHKEKQDGERQIDPIENLWSSDEIAIIRSAYMTIRDDCLRLKSENDYYRKHMDILQNKFDETNKSLEKLQEDYLSLQKIHTRWTLRTNSSEQLLDEQRQENKELIVHIEKLTEQNEFYRRNHLQMQSSLLEKQTRVEHLENKIEHYDKTIKNECNRRIGLVEKRAQVDKDRLKIDKNDLQTKLDKEQELRRQNLLALDQLRKHIALPNQHEKEQSLCDIKHVKYV